MSNTTKVRKMRRLEDRQGRKQRPWKENYTFSLFAYAGLSAVWDEVG